MEELKITSILYQNPHQNIIHTYEILMNNEHDFIYLISQLCEDGELMIRVHKSDEEFEYFYNKDALTEIINANDEFRVYKSEMKESEENIFIDNTYSISKRFLKELKGELKIKLTKFIFKQILEGLNHLHNNKICHRDLKPENILFCKEDGFFKIIDFSISTIVGERTKIDEPSGSLFFQSPEIIDSQTGYDPYKNDIWSIGVLMYLFYTKELPFKGESEIEIQIKTTQDAEVYSENFDKTLKNLLEKMLNKNPDERINLKEILDHEFFNP